MKPLSLSMKVYAIYKNIIMLPTLATDVYTTGIAKTSDYQNERYFEKLMSRSSCAAFHIHIICDCPVYYWFVHYGVYLQMFII